MKVKNSNILHVHVAAAAAPSFHSRQKLCYQKQHTDIGNALCDVGKAHILQLTGRAKESETPPMRRLGPSPSPRQSAKRPPSHSPSDKSASAATVRRSRARKGRRESSINAA